MTDSEAFLSNLQQPAGPRLPTPAKAAHAVRNPPSEASYDFIILTAAITRPDLHTRIFPGYLRLIGTARVKWLINIDPVASGTCVEDTIDNLRRLLAAPNIDLEFLGGEEPGCFFKAARRLSERAGELLARCRTGVVWLEDDWRLTAHGSGWETLTRLRLGLATTRAGRRCRGCRGPLSTKQAALDRQTTQRNPLWFVSLVPRSRVSFNPGIWSKEFFVRAVLEPLRRQPANKVDDPETLCADPWNKPQARRLFTLFVDPTFQDAGRQWSVECGLTKWIKEPDDLAKRGSVTYATDDGHVQPLRGGAFEDAIGWVRIRRAFGTPLPLLGRIVLSEGRLAGHLLAVPYLAFDMQPIGERMAEVYLHRPHRWSRTYPYKKIDGRIVWGAEDAEVHVQTRRGKVVGSLTRTLPVSSYWIVPLQASLGLIYFASSLIGRLLHLDAESKTP
ncbi:hypothetical protein DFR24_3312 [Panacagrimonas perspica]|uniref:Uncharacterized protein n=2 Tax=Panacagrimonas perspica TaxID=381431 RepID=A0A4S3K2M7_9GAMM|nr:hypothetical protein DFR24_3312 [Panacagrimonas perspica]THD02247.1 hypothetical protein B1810_15060 [Panacagrimonas perspica]